MIVSELALAEGTDGQGTDVAGGQAGGRDGSWARLHYY